MATKYLYWNSESNSGTSFNYSRLISDPERAALIPGKTMIFGITYRSTSGTLYPALTISNLKLCSTAAVSVTEIPRSESLETVGGKQIVTKYFSATVPELVVGNSSLTFSLSFNSSATILDCALFQGSALSMKNVHEVDKFSQFMKYDGGWKIRTGTGENDFVELTTDHSTKTSGVHGVGSGQVVGTNLTQTLTNKTLSNVTLNNGVKGDSVVTGGIETWNSDSQIVSAKALKTKIEAIVVSANVGEHNQKYNHTDKNNFDTETQVHGLFVDDGDVVGTDKVQTLTRKTITDPIIHIGGDAPWIKFKKSYNTGTAYESAERYLHGIDTFKSGSNYLTPMKYSELSGTDTMVTSSKTIKNILADLFTPVYANSRFTQNIRPAGTNWTGRFWLASRENGVVFNNLKNVGFMSANELDLWSMTSFVITAGGYTNTTPINPDIRKISMYKLKSIGYYSIKLNYDVTNTVTTNLETCRSRTFLIFGHITSNGFVQDSTTELNEVDSFATPEIGLTSNPSYEYIYKNTSENTNICVPLLVDVNGILDSVRYTITITKLPYID